MFVALVFDFSNEDHKKDAEQVILQYGFSRIMENLFESSTISEAYLTRLKHDLDRITDSYDSLRFYQYPVENTLAITSLKEKKWRRLIVRL